MSSLAFVIILSVASAAALALLSLLPHRRGCWCVDCKGVLKLPATLPTAPARPPIPGPSPFPTGGHGHEETPAVLVDRSSADPLGYHVIGGTLLLESMRRCERGEKADLVYAELWANADREDA